MFVAGAIPLVITVPRPGTGGSRAGVPTRSTSTSTGRVVNISTRGPSTTLFVRATPTIGHGGSASGTFGGGIICKTSTQATRVGQNAVVHVGSGAVDFTRGHEDIVADFDELDAVDFDFLAVGDGGNCGFGGVSGKG